MTGYILRRIGIALITLFFSTILIFVIIKLPPGDFVSYAISQSGGEGGINSIADRMRESYGLDRPVIEQYVRWVSGLVRGDLGYSFLYQQPVLKIVWGQMGWTVLITGLSMVLSWGIGSAIGIFSALKKYSFWDYLFTAFGFLGLSIPSFFLALIIIYVCVSVGSGVTGGLFSPEYIVAPWSWARFWDLLRHIWIPVVAIGTAHMAQVIRIMRGNLLDVMNQPFIKTARAKGLSERKVIFKHAVRIAMNPLISLAGLSAPALVSGIVVTAVVLNLPVIGPTFIVALKSQDMYLAGGYLLLMVVLLLIGNILADILLAWSDPRIRFD